MAVDISYTPPIRLNASQELKLLQPDTDLYVGQILKAVVIKAVSDNEVLLTINGQNINAKTAHHLEPGNVLQVKVLNTEGEINLQIMRDKISLSPIETALAQTLPKQAPATQLLTVLSTLQSAAELPSAIRQQIQQLLATVTTVNQLPYQLAQAITQSGLFWEAALLNSRQDSKNNRLQNDFKGQCLRLLGLLMEAGAKPSGQASNSPPSLLTYENISLTGTSQKSLPQSPVNAFAEQPMAEILTILRNQTEQVLARIKTSQLTHLLTKNDQAFFLTLDLPVRTETGIDVIPLSIREYQQQSSESNSSTWSIDFALNLQNLGTLQACVKLHNTGVDIQIHAEKQETVELLNGYQQGMDQLLSGLGLTLRLWSLHLGLEDHEKHIDNHELRLLDIRI